MKKRTLFFLLKVICSTLITLFILSVLKNMELGFTEVIITLVGTSVFVLIFELVEKK